MSKLLSFLISAIIFLGLLFVTIPVIAQSGTNESGIITSDTTWNRANSPHNLASNILVDDKTTLTIECIFVSGIYSEKR